MSCGVRTAHLIRLLRGRGSPTRVALDMCRLDRQHVRQEAGRAGRPDSYATDDSVSYGESR